MEYHAPNFNTEFKNIKTIKQGKNRCQVIMLGWGMGVCKCDKGQRLIRKLSQKTTHRMAETFLQKIFFTLKTYTFKISGNCPKTTQEMSKHSFSKMHWISVRRFEQWLTLSEPQVRAVEALAWVLRCRRAQPSRRGFAPHLQIPVWGYCFTQGGNDCHHRILLPQERTKQVQNTLLMTGAGSQVTEEKNKHTV